MLVDKVMNDLKRRNPNEPEFLQAVHEVLISIQQVYNANPHFDAVGLIERLTEPDRVLTFKVPWVDDQGKVYVNRGFRVQFNNAIGPYKGGIRFHPSVNLSTMKFLAFEQTFKNSLTTLAMGGAKGGSDFDPKGKSVNEIMRFCQSFMLELWKIIGPDKDVPAGDIGVGTREVGFLYGMYKKLLNEHHGVLTGKGISWGGSLVRPEATGYGVVYFAQEMLATKGVKTIEGSKIAVSGFGNVAWGAVKKATELGAKVITLSGPDGYIFDADGVKGEKIDFMLELRASNQDIVKPYSDEFKVPFHAGKRPWEVPCDIALPCAIQNELQASDAEQLVKNGCQCVCEGANMPCTPEAIEIIQKNKLLYSPGKASNAGGVATSGLEMSQNAMKLNWSSSEVDEKLHQIMKRIHESCVKYGNSDGYTDYVRGANIAGFIKVANAMVEQGII